MSNSIVLKHGLDIPIKGEAALQISKTVTPDIVAVKPTDYKGLTPRLLVREGDKVLAGSPLLSSKESPDVLVTSPVSGVVKGIVRGAKRKLLEVRIEADKTQEYVDFGARNVTSLSEDDVKTALLKSGLWTAIVQRPYGIVAKPEVKPKAIFVSAFNTAPLAADLDYVLGDRLEDIQAGVDALSKLTNGGVHISINGEKASSTPFHKIENAALHEFVGKHPAGNVGVQISHISPILKDETVWTVSLLMVAAIGKFFKTGKLDLTRKIAVTGPAAKNPSYIQGIAGMSMKAVADFYEGDNVRVISGDPLTGEAVGPEGFLGFFDNQVTLIKEGTEREVLGWAKPFRLNLFSSTRSYFSWLTPKKKYKMDTNLHGGPRAFVCSDVYGKVLPMDIYPLYLIKACIAQDIDKMEKFGIYEVLPEDLALCEFVDPSKNNIQEIIQSGIDLMLKEMA